MDDEGVSPVIATLLMVAITVVLAAVVFVLVNGIGDGADDTPAVTFVKDGGERSLTIIQAPAGLAAILWGDLAIGGTATCTWPAADAAIVAGHAITCSTPGTLTVAHTATNTLLYETEFA